MESVLPFLWFFLLTGTMLLFIILDGSDLGLGIMSLLSRESQKAAIIDAVGPLWYANETWLVIAGAILFGAFPLAYSLILSSLYIPVMALIFGLIFRAASTEFRKQAHQQRLWNWIFGAGCLLAALGLGFLIGGLLTSPEAIGSAGSTWGWFNPVSGLIALGVAAAFVMAGAAHITRRPGGEIPPEVRRFRRYTIILTLALFLTVMVLVAVTLPAYASVWSAGYRRIWTLLFGGATALCLAAAWPSSRSKTGSAGPYAWSVAAFLSAGGTVVAVIYPCIIPFSITIPEAASPTSSLVFMLFGVGILLPVIILYNFYVARVFSRKGPQSRK